MKAESSLYIHVPFCSSLCDYCDFYSVVPDNAAGNMLMDNYIKAVIEDIKFQIEFFNISSIPTAYIGGGTPSVLGGQRLGILFKFLNSIAAFSPKELTIEANPESITEEILSVCREGGVNRISLGVQSFHEPSLRAVNRCKTELTLVSQFFPGAFSADIITGLPFQTKETVQSDIDRLLSFAPDHVSLYSLSVEDGTPLEKKIIAKNIFVPDAGEADELWLVGFSALQKAGFEHYEVSNFSLPGKRCLHNIRYWQMENWLGVGPAASGTIINGETATAKRFSFAPDVNAYIKSPSIHSAVCEILDRTTLLKETLLMGYRYVEGPDREKFKRRFGCTIEDCIGKTLARWEGREIMLFLNSFLSEAFLEAETCTF